MNKKSLILFYLTSVLAFSQNSTAGLNYISTGNPAGIPVVFVHAFPLNQSMWSEQVEAVKDIAHVITFDIRGFGKSSLDAPYTLEFIVDDLIGLLDQLKIPKAVVCGLSMGGFVALRAIERNPERFMGAVLADTKSEPDSDSSKLGRYKALKTIEQSGVEKFIDEFLRSSIAPDNRTKNSKIFDQASTIARSNPTAGISAGLLALTSRTDTSAGLNGIRVPVLIMQGEMDTVIPIASAKSLHEKISSSEFFIIPKAGHLSNLENPEAFNERLIQFLKKLKR